MQNLEENLKLIRPFHHQVNPKMFDKIYINLMLYINNSTTKKNIYIILTIIIIIIKKWALIKINLKYI